jgi:hypothetical protein
MEIVHQNVCKITLGATVEQNLTGNASTGDGYEN